MKTRIVIVAFVMTFLVWIGTSLGRWAESESRANEVRMANAMSVLGGER